MKTREELALHLARYGPGNVYEHRLLIGLVAHANSELVVSPTAFPAICRESGFSRTMLGNVLEHLEAHSWIQTGTDFLEILDPTIQ